MINAINRKRFVEIAAKVHRCALDEEGSICDEFHTQIEERLMEEAVKHGQFRARPPGEFVYGIWGDVHSSFHKIAGILNRGLWKACKEEHPIQYSKYRKNEKSMTGDILDLASDSLSQIVHDGETWAEEFIASAYGIIWDIGCEVELSHNLRRADDGRYEEEFLANNQGKKWIDAMVRRLINEWVNPMI